MHSYSAVPKPYSPNHCASSPCAIHSVVHKKRNHAPIVPRWQIASHAVPETSAKCAPKNQVSEANPTKDKAFNLVTAFIQNNHTNGKAKVFKILAHAKEVSRHVIIEEEILDLLLHLRFTFLRLIHQSRPIAHLRVKHLACTQCFVTLNKFNHIKQHFGHLLPTAYSSVCH